MNASCEGRRIELTLPAEKDMMLLVRLTASGVLARSGVTLDRMDDLKMAVEEACGCIIAQIRRPGRIALRFLLREKELELLCECAGDCADVTPMEEAEREMTKCILESLADRVQLEPCEDGTVRAIRLTMALPR